MKRFIAAAVALVLTATAALAQQLPFTIPANTVVGRTSATGSSGAATAIPFAQFAAALAQLGLPAGTPSSINLANGTNLPTTALVGTLQAAQEPAHAGDCSNSAGSLVLICSQAAANFNVIGSLTVGGTPVLFSGGALGTPSSGVGTNLTGIPTTGLTGVLQAAQEPAHTGDVTNSASSLALTIAANAVTNAKAAQMGANTIKANNTGGTANASDITPGAAGAMLCNPQFFGSGAGTSTYTTPTCNSVTAKYIIVDLQGAGAGGAGSGTTPGAAAVGGNSTFGTALLTANGGAAGLVGAATGVGAAGGTATGCDVNLTGGPGGPGENTASRAGGAGGASFYGGSAPAGILLAVAGLNAAPNSGSGGSGASAGGTLGSGGGGAAGGWCRKLIVAPLASYAFTVGAKGNGGTLGTGGAAGGNGADGVLSVTAYFQ